LSLVVVLVSIIYPFGIICAAINIFILKSLFCALGGIEGLAMGI